MRKLFILLLGVSLIFPAITEAHRSGCHRWHTCPSDTGSYQIQSNPNTGKPIPYCGKSMYLGIDGKCHYYATKNAPPPTISVPQTQGQPKQQTPSVPSNISQQANVSQAAKQAQLEELQRKIADLLSQIATLQTQLKVLKK